MNREDFNILTWPIHVLTQSLKEAGFLLACLVAFMVSFILWVFKGTPIISQDEIMLIEFWLALTSPAWILAILIFCFRDKNTSKGKVQENEAWRLLRTLEHNRRKNRFHLFEELFPDASRNECALWLPRFPSDRLYAAPSSYKAHWMALSGKCNSGQDLNIATEDFRTKRDAHIQWQHEDFANRYDDWTGYPGFQGGIPPLGEARVYRQGERNKSYYTGRDSWAEYDDDGNSVWGNYYNPSNHTYKTNPQPEEETDED
jgi:hypothetical protein